MDSSPLPRSRFATRVAILLLLPLVALSEEKKEPALTWHDVSTFGVEGQGWDPDYLASRYDRLPAKAENIVRAPVWNLSRDSAGMSFRFNTDATSFTIRYRLGDNGIAMPHMPATGVSGVDLYALDNDGKWKWVSVSRPAAQDAKLEVSGLDPGKRTYLAYLPLYNSVTKIEVGIPAGAVFEPVAPRSKKPIVFYGTSITHGACASRPGMIHPSILGRRLAHPVVNLGFSGNGRMEPEVGALLCEIDAAVYVIDCLPNMDGKAVAERAEPLVRQIRDIRPDTPIVLVEDRTFTNAWIFKARRDRHEENRASLIRAFDNLVSSGVKDLYYIEGEPLLGDDTEGATDGSHPNDLGFLRQADAFESVLRQALGTE